MARKGSLLARQQAQKGAVNARKQGDLVSPTAALFEILSELFRPYHLVDPVDPVKIDLSFRAICISSPRL